MDVIAYNPLTKRRLGITVKSRTRIFGTEKENIFLFKRIKKDREKLVDACEAFQCEPWIAVYTECDKDADLFLTSLANYEAKYKKKEIKTNAWEMTQKYRSAYEKDSEVRHIRITFEANNWWPQ